MKTLLIWSSLANNQRQVWLGVSDTLHWEGETQGATAKTQLITEETCQRAGMTYTLRQTVQSKAKQRTRSYRLTYFTPERDLWFSNQCNRVLRYRKAQI